MFLGVVLQVEVRDTYNKIVAGVETGYNSDCYILRVKHTINIAVVVGDKILFTGYTMSRDGLEQFNVESFVKRDFSSCLKCGLPLTSYVCLVRHDAEAQRLFGNWKVVHKIKSKGHVKIFFEKENFVFAAVTSPKLWIHPIFLELIENDIVNLEGWRYRQRTSIKYIKKVQVEE